MNIDFTLPELGENVGSGDVVKVLVHEGDVIAGNDGVIELETDKAVVEIPCPHAGKVAKIHVSKGQTIRVGEPVLSIEAEEAEELLPAAAPAPSPESTHPPSTIHHPPSAVPAGPEARRLARASGVDLSEVRGTGKGGRITADDVRAAAQGPRTGPLPKEEETEQAGAVRDAHGPVRRERMSKIRRTIAAQMVKSAGTIPHVTNFDDADVTELDHIRKTVPPAFLGPEVRLTAMPFVAKAVAVALRQHPVLNATLDEDQEEIVYKQYVNLGVAVDTPRGLVVPVIRNVDQKAVLQIAKELTQVAARARSAEFTIEELRGGTFTISNLGTVGGAYSTPIINHPEVAILLLGRSRWMPTVHEDNIEKRLILPLSLSYDHRVVDGAAAARFLGDVIGYLQSPGKLLLTQ